MDPVRVRVRARAAIRASRFASLMLLVGCTGAIGPESGDRAEDAARPGGSGPKPPPGSPGDEPGGSTSPQPAGEAGLPGPLPLLRLSRIEHQNTLRDLLGESAAAEDLPPDANAESGYLKGGPISATDARRLLEVGEAVGARVLSRVGTLVRCQPGQSEPDCASAFIKSFGRRAYRRPLTTGEETRLRGLYDRARGELKQDFANAVRILVQAIVQSPAFLYHWELGPQGPKVEGRVVRLTAHEVASRLSYFLWRSMPDDVLLGEADRGGLGAPAAIEAQARRMLADKRARDTIADFHAQWLRVADLEAAGKERSVYPSYTTALATAMRTELAEFTSQVVLGDGKGSLETLLTAPFTYAAPDVAALYGASGAGADLRKVMLPAMQRAGLLTQSAFLTRHATPVGSHPVKRGHAVAERLLCLEFPPVPADVPAPKPPAPNLTTRERFVEHGRNECAKACHAIIDPLGFAFEHYDGVGSWRVMESGKPVDASGQILLPSGGRLSFTNAVDLVRQLARNADTTACVATQWFRFALGRHDVPGDAAALKAVRDAFEGARLDLRELLVSITRSPSFTQRTLAEGEVAQ